MKQLFKVVAQQEPVTIQKSDGSQLNKSTIVLQEPGGKYENSYVAALLGSSALCKFSAGDLVFAALRFQHYEYQGKYYNEITVQDIIKLNY